MQTFNFSVSNITVKKMKACVETCNVKKVESDDIEYSLKPRTIK